MEWFFLDCVLTYQADYFIEVILQGGAWVLYLAVAFLADVVAWVAHMLF